MLYELYDVDSTKGMCRGLVTSPSSISLPAPTETLTMGTYTIRIIAETISYLTWRFTDHTMLKQELELAKTRKNKFATKSYW